MGRFTWPLIVLASTWSVEALARPMGEPQPCNNCHYKSVGPMVMVTPSDPQPKPGATITLTVALKATDPGARRTGIMLTADNGRLALVDTMQTRLEDPMVALHSRPRDLMNGAAQYQFRWTAPSKPGISTFVVWSMTSNDTKRSDLYNSGSGRLSLAVGCDAKIYYPDRDKDGAGDEKEGVLSCTPVADHILVGGVCKDNNPAIKPGAPEICNSVDDNCDGVIDEGLEPGLYYPDEDGDGFAPQGARPVFTCKDKPGFTQKLGDCAPMDPKVFPGAKEIVNGIDDNCDGRIDEGTEMNQPVGSNAAPPTASPPPKPASTAKPAAPAADSAEADDDLQGGCAISPRGSKDKSVAMLLFGLMVAATIARRRSRSHGP